MKHWITANEMVTLRPFILRDSVGGLEIDAVTLTGALASIPGDRVLAVGMESRAAELKHMFAAITFLDCRPDKLATASPYGQAILGDPSNLKMPANTVDGIVTDLPAILDLPAFLAECRRVLRPGGLLVAFSGSAIPKMKSMAAAVNMNARSRPVGDGLYAWQVEPVGRTDWKWRFWCAALLLPAGLAMALVAIDEFTMDNRALKPMRAAFVGALKRLGIK